MIFTDHATERFKKRFPSLDMKQEFLKSTPCGRRSISKIRKNCPKHAEVTSRNFKGYYYMINPQSNMVFVVTPPEIIVTVFSYKEGKWIRPPPNIKRMLR